MHISKYQNDEFLGGCDSTQKMLNTSLFLKQSAKKMSNVERKTRKTAI